MKKNDASKNKIKEILGLVLICIIVFLQLLAQTDNSPPTLDDASKYISLGSNIVSGQGYIDTFSHDKHPHTRYPFAYPLVLSGIIYMWGCNYFIMRLANVLLFLFSLVLIYILMRRRANTFTSYVVVVLTATSVFALNYVFLIYSEMTYTFFSILGLIFVEKYASSKNIFSSSLIPAVLFVICAFFTRLIGISLVIATCLFLLFEGNKTQGRGASLQKFVVAGIVTLLPVFLWFLRDYYIHRALTLSYISPNISWFSKNGGFFLGIIKNLYGLIFCAFPSMISSISIEQRSVLGFLLSFIMLCGVATKFAKKRTIVEYYFGAYLCILLFWYPTHFCKRLLVPIIPFIFYYFVEGIYCLANRLQRR